MSSTVAPGNPVVLAEPARRATVAVILCAGQGTRVGAGMNKILLPIHGQPLLLFSLQALAAAPEIDAILLVAHPREVATIHALVRQHPAGASVWAVIPGGDSRHASEDAALAFLRPSVVTGENRVILIHDGARPFVTVADIAALVAVASRGEGAVLASPVALSAGIARITADGLAHGVDGVDGVSRILWCAQTPQAFPSAPLLSAYDAARAARREGTDTAMTFAQSDLPIRVVAAQGPNFKLTTPEDIQLAEYLADHARPDETGSTDHPAALE